MESIKDKLTLKLDGLHYVIEANALKFKVPSGGVLLYTTIRGIRSPLSNQLKYFINVENKVTGRSKTVGNI